MGDFDVGTVCEEEEDAEDAPLGDEDGELYDYSCEKDYVTLAATFCHSSTQQPDSVQLSERTTLSFMNLLRDPT
jgi:hypothetical protein